MLFVGDWAPGHKPVEALIQSDLAVINLEGPIYHPETSDTNNWETQKAGPLLANSSLPNFSTSNIYNLANNHFMDYGSTVCDENISLIDRTGDRYMGYGSNLDEARKPLIIEYQDVKIGLLSATENLFGAAGFQNPGLSILGPWMYSELADLNSRVDFIVVNIHGGFEDSRWPTPDTLDRYRSLIDAGANLVIGHHPHVIQGYEEYKSGFIAYGLGNFVIDPLAWKDYKNATESLGIDLNFIDRKPRIQLRYFETSALGNQIIVKEKIKDSKLDQYINACLVPIKDRELLSEIWLHISLAKGREYGLRYLGAYFERKFQYSIRGKFYNYFKGIRDSTDSPLENIRKMNLTRHMISGESNRELILNSLISEPAHNIHKCRKAHELINESGILQGNA
jgi:hypothetical protein